MFDFFFMGILFVGFIVLTLIGRIPAITRRFRNRRKERGNEAFQQRADKQQDVIESYFVDDPEDNDRSESS